MLTSWRSSAGEYLAYLLVDEILTLHILSSELDLFKGLSFTTISSTGPNGGA